MNIKLPRLIVYGLMVLNMPIAALEKNYLTEFNESYLLFYNQGNSKMVMRDSINVYERSDKSSKIIKVLNRGDIVIEIEKVKSKNTSTNPKVWMRVRIYPNSEGWIPCCNDIKAYDESPVEILAKAALIYEHDPEEAERLLVLLKREFPNAEYYDYDETLKKYSLSEMADYYLALANSCKRPHYYANTLNELVNNIKLGLQNQDQDKIYKYASCSFSIEETKHEYCYLAGKKYPPENSLSDLNALASGLDWKLRSFLPYGIKVPLIYENKKRGFVVFYTSAGDKGIQ